MNITTYLKIKSLLFVLVIIGMGSAVFTGYSQEIVFGDVNKNGTVDIVDAMLVAQYSAGMMPAVFDTGAADVNCDQLINITDALLIARYAAGVTSILGCSSTPVPTPTQTPTGDWIPYCVNASQVITILDVAGGLVHLEFVFPDAGYRIASPGIKVNMHHPSITPTPDGKSYLTFEVRDILVEKYTGASAAVITKLRTTYTMSYNADVTRCAFKALCNDGQYTNIGYLLYNRPSLSPTPSPTPASTPPAPAWVPALPPIKSIALCPIPERNLVYGELTFPTSGYRLANKGTTVRTTEVDLIDGKTIYVYNTTGTVIETWTGSHTNTPLIISFDYTIEYGPATRFVFNLTDGTYTRRITDMREPPYTYPVPTPTPTAAP